MNTTAPDGYKSTCWKKLAEHWKKWKSTVKLQYYKKVKEEPTRLLIPPDRVRPEDWTLLVAYWQTKTCEAQAEKNRLNRKQYEFPHRTGRKSFSNVRLEVKLILECHF